MVNDADRTHIAVKIRELLYRGKGERLFENASEFFRNVAEFSNFTDGGSASSAFRNVICGKADLTPDLERGMRLAFYRRVRRIDGSVKRSGSFEDAEKRSEQERVFESCLYPLARCRTLKPSPEDSAGFEFALMRADIVSVITGPADPIALSSECTGLDKVFYELVAYNNRPRQALLAQPKMVIATSTEAAAKFYLARMILPALYCYIFTYNNDDRDIRSLNIERDRINKKLDWKELFSPETGIGMRLCNELVSARISPFASLFGTHIVVNNGGHADSFVCLNSYVKDDCIEPRSRQRPHESLEDGLSSQDFLGQARLRILRNHDLSYKNTVSDSLKFIDGYSIPYDLRNCFNFFYAALNYIHWTFIHSFLGVACSDEELQAPEGLLSEKENGNVLISKLLSINDSRGFKKILADRQYR